MKVQLCIPDGLHLLRPFLNVHGGLVTALFVELSTRGAEWSGHLRCGDLSASSCAQRAPVDDPPSPANWTQSSPNLSLVHLLSKGFDIP